MAAFRATILQPDPHVPADRLGQWLASNHVLVRAVPLWQRPIPPLSELGDSLIVLGGTMNAHDSSQPWISPLQELLVEAVAAEIPTLAICLGHQILAEAFGGQVEVAHPGGGEHGVAEIHWAPEAAADPLLGRLVQEGSSWVAESHHDAVVTLPAGAVELARTNAYANQAFRIGSALGVQFHPEASPELMGRWAELDGADGHAMRRTMQAQDSEVSRTGRLLTQGFYSQLRAATVAA